MREVTFQWQSLALGHVVDEDWSLWWREPSAVSRGGNEDGTPKRWTEIRVSRTVVILNHAGLLHLAGVILAYVGLQIRRSPCWIRQGQGQIHQTAMVAVESAQLTSSSSAASSTSHHRPQPLAMMARRTEYDRDLLPSRLRGTNGWEGDQRRRLARLAVASRVW